MARSVQKPMGFSNELMFQRKYERSQVLLGFAGPYYELSTYNLRINVMAGPDKNFSRALGLSITQGLTISVGSRGTYAEPTTEQVERYKSTLADIVDQVVREVAGEAKAEIVDGVGVL